MTVGSCLTHPIMGTTQQFRRNVTLKELDEILVNPRTHTDKGYYKANSKVANPSESAESEIDFLRSHVRLLSDQLDSAQRELGILVAAEAVKKKQEEEVIEKQREIERKRKRDEEQADLERIAAVEKKLRQEGEECERQEKRRRRGRNVWWSLQYSDDVPDDLENIKCIAIGNGGFIAITERGTCYYHGIPSNVIDQVKRVQCSNLDLISIGPDNHYYMLKTNGKQYGSVSDDIWESMNEYIHHGPL